MAKAPEKHEEPAAEEKPAPKKKSTEERLAALEATVGIREPAEDDE